MCPDRQLLSTYFDGELPSPWKEKMESHIAGCPDCRGRLNVYAALSTGAGEEDLIPAAQRRVWQNLESYTVGETRPFTVTRGDWGALWQRRVSVPIPAAAAIAFIIIAFALVWTMGTRRGAGQPGSMGTVLAAESDFEAPGIIPVADMGEVLQYLGSRDTSDVLIIRLPESRNFESYGEPAILKAADYARQTPNRQTQGRRRP